ncbi:hypothetical protein BPNPMPFG_006313 [Mesorhizobium sp. AR07]|uniref:hypothetical protein n=1 Tax=Mesorhizobium sp. AR07 TaxID=2865838 RepID=UPI00215FD2D5|nr:hypothetical protein [Mesorhizobium sp. AR07]UVK44398.1 hypothetical protein BPNPMPFG_006313 [Mesorhizobium sp. AR07]
MQQGFTSNLEVTRVEKDGKTVGRQHEETTFMDATAGLCGVARTLALEARRYYSNGMRARAVGPDQMLDLQCNAGHRIEQMSARLFKLDGRTATMADLSDDVRRIDADALSLPRLRDEHQIISAAGRRFSRGVAGEDGRTPQPEFGGAFPAAPFCWPDRR